jgi:hypothetical protein
VEEVPEEVEVEEEAVDGSIISFPAASFCAQRIDKTCLMLYKGYLEFI